MADTQAVFIIKMCSYQSAVGQRLHGVGGDVGCERDGRQREVFVAPVVARKNLRKWQVVRT